jgi:multidrug efflux pump subunit AcrA (membrane-fusion protein)
MMKTRTLPIFALATLLAAFAAGCRDTSAPGPAEAGEFPAGIAPAGTVVLTAEAVRGGGISVQEARLVRLSRTVRALGEFEFSSRLMAEVSARASGRIERLTAYLGDRVAAGQVLAEITAPDYLALQAETLLAGERAARLKAEADGPSAAAVLDAVRKKLFLLGVSDREIDDLLSTRTIRATLAVRAPIAGVVIESAAVAGGPVEPATVLFRVADPSRLWAAVRVYEKDLASVRTGMEAVLTTRAYPEAEFHGRLFFIGATMDDKTRTVEGRIEVANPDGRLKSGMFVEAALRMDGDRQAVVVPEAAIQEVQSRPAVFVQTGPGTFVLRPIEAGEHSGGSVEVVQGLAEGEKIVTAGAFLLKSELLKKSLGD